MNTDETNGLTEPSYEPYSNKQRKQPVNKPFMRARRSTTKQLVKLLHICSN